jgi:hypothetical protein
MIAAAASMPDRGSCCAISYAGVEMLPLGLSDQDAITRAHTLSSKRKGPFDGFEVWDHARFVWLPSAVTLAPSLRCASELGA